MQSKPTFKSKNFTTIKIVFRTILMVVFLFPHRGLGGFVSAHPMPNSVVLLKIHEKHISGEVQLPLGELQSAIGMKVNDNSEKLIERLGDSLRIYLLKHIRPRTFDGKFWQVQLGEMQVTETKSPLSGSYKELTVAFSMIPPQFYDLRNFYFDYDVILHQVASHKILVNIKQDWEQGIVTEDSTAQQIGVIELDIPTNKIPVFQVSLRQGSIWIGFKSMVLLGIRHIAEGTDHILFLLVLLLPVPLIVSNKKWGSFGNVRQSLIHVLKIVTAFTLGHSLTLVFGALDWLNFPSKIIEILIAVSILVSAMHAIKPIFPKRETLIAFGFGLIHGLAFANTLLDLDLATNLLVLSIFGFNVGIELMQIFVITITIPWLILLSRTRFYGIFRIFGAILAGISAIGWIVERLFQQTNFVTLGIERVTDYSFWLLFILAFVAVLGYFLEKRRFFFR